MQEGHLPTDTTRGTERFAASFDASSRPFGEAADKLPVMLRHTGPDGQCDFVNARWLAVTGRGHEQELGSGWTEAIHPDDLDRGVALLEAALEAGQAFTLEYRLRNRDGAYRWLVEQGEPEFDGDNGIAGFVHACIDITERRDSESHRQQGLEETGLLLRELQHRVRNHFQMLISLLQIRSRQAKSSETRQELEEAAQRARTVGLLQEHLDPARRDGRIPLGAYLHDLCRQRTSAGARQGIQLSVQSDASELPVETALSTALVVEELIANAFAHAFLGGGPGRVRVVVAGDDGEVTVMVADDGVGVPETVDPTTAGTNGMTVIRTLVNQMGAGIHLEGEHGTKAILSVPWCRRFGVP